MFGSLKEIKRLEPVHIPMLGDLSEDVNLL